MKEISYEVLTKTEGSQAGEFMVSMHPQHADVAKVAGAINGRHIDVKYGDGTEIRLIDFPAAALKRAALEKQILVGELSAKGIEKAYLIPLS